MTKNPPVLLKDRKTGAPRLRVLFLIWGLLLVTGFSVVGAVLIVQRVVQITRARGAPLTFVENFSTDRYRDPSSQAKWDTASGLLSIEKEDGQYSEKAAAQSLQVDQTDAEIVSASITAASDPQLGIIRYELSNNGGTTFFEVQQGIEHTFATKGSDLRWRVTLARGPDAMTTPVVDQLSVSYSLVQ